MLLNPLRRSEHRKARGAYDSSASDRCRRLFQMDLDHPGVQFPMFGITPAKERFLPDVRNSDIRDEGHSLFASMIGSFENKARIVQIGIGTSEADRRVLFKLGYSP